VKRLAFPILVGVLGTLVLVWLGSWQVQRLGWKEDLLSSIDARIGAAPVAVPDSPSFESDRFLPVTVEGALGERTINVLASLKVVGAVHRKIAVLETEGRRLLVDLGYIRVGQPEPEIGGAKVTLTGNLDWPNETDSFTPGPDTATGLWFARDVEALAAELRAEPFLIVARSMEPGISGITQHPVDSSGIPNDHLEYAITWFSLAVIWIGMTGFWVWRNRARVDSDEQS